MALALLACGPRLPSTDGGDQTTSGEASGSSGDTTEEGEPETGMPETGETATDEGTCGDGVLDPGEACDEGPNNGPTGNCLSDCTLNVCGDGMLGPGEECDDGNLDDADGCSARCTLEVIRCDGNKVYECGDGVDNDRDGLIDTDDLECVTPCDDSEGDLCDWQFQGADECSFDCPFDANYLAGDDSCDAWYGCYPQDPPTNTGCEYPDPQQVPHCTAELDPDCFDFCGPLLPNGCDCFGCCLVDGQGVLLNTYKWMDQIFGCCDLDQLDYCWTCEPRLDCFNPCEPDECELCFGQTIDALAPGCSEPACPPGHSSCASFHDCPEGWFCQTGCCLEAPSD